MSTATPLSDIPEFALRHRVGRWLWRYRRWAIVPLLGAGLLTDSHAYSVHTGIGMMIAGMTGILFGSLLRIISFKFTGPVRWDDPEISPSFNQDGPYAITRNPVYLGEAAFALGIAMMSRMPWLVLTTLIAVIIGAALIIDWEETSNSRSHGSTYAAYCRTVPRWFSLSRLTDTESYLKTRGKVKLLRAVRAESVTLLIALLSILAFLAKANFEIFV